MIDVSDTEHSGLGLRHQLDVIRRRKWIVLSVFATAVAAAALFSGIERSTYRAESKLVVGQGRSLLQPTVVGAAIQPYTATMADLLKSNAVAERVIRQLNLTKSPEDLLNKATVSISPQTAVMKLSVDDHSGADARVINASMGHVFAALVQQRFGRGTPASGSAPATPPLTVTIFDPAHVLPGRVSPKPVRNILIAGILGLVLGLLAAFLRDHFDRGLRTREMVEKAFGVPVIGQVPFAKMRKRDRRTVFWEGHGEVAEAFRGLRANLQYLAVKRPLRTILVTSASPQQGKTTVAANLALAIARSGASTIVLEGDLRRPRLDDAFEVSPHGPGLTSVLVGAVDIDEAIVDMAMPASEDEASRGQRPGRLSFLPSGPQPPNPSELLSSLQMTKLLDRLALAYDYVLIDSPPVLVVADALELARLVDGVVVVVRRNHASTDEARELRAMVERLGINLLGVVFTDVVPAGLYYGGYRDQPLAGKQELADELESIAHEEF
jgi:capsular exopolysaccharide synthesis family protein